MNRQETLDAAKSAVADRPTNYGTPENNFQNIARLLIVHLYNRFGISIALEPHDVAIMLAMVKIARLESNPTHEDSWTDLAGYAACGAEVAK